MKKIFTIIALSVAGIVANGQGFIITSQVSAAVKTNTAAFSPGSQGSGTSGNVATTANQYFYALLYSSGSLTGSSAPTNSGWTVVTKDGGAFLGITNSSILAGGIAGTGGSGGVAINAAAGTPINVNSLAGRLVWVGLQPYHRFCLSSLLEAGLRMVSSITAQLAR